MNPFDESQKAKAAGLPTQTAFNTVFNLNDTSGINQRAIALHVIKQGPTTTVQLRHDWGIMHPAARIQELRDRGYRIETIRTTSFTPDGIKHKAVARYVYWGKRDE